jgi:hypothetical protein
MATGIAPSLWLVDIALDEPWVVTLGQAGRPSAAAIAWVVTPGVRREAERMKQTLNCKGCGVHWESRFQEWVATPESAHRQARQDPGNQSKLDKVRKENAVVVWKRKVPFAFSQRGFQLRTAMLVKVAETLDDDEGAATAQKMPKIAGKVLSAYARGGKMIGAAHQTGQCAPGDSCPQGKHACAVLLRSGRIRGPGGNPGPSRGEGAPRAKRAAAKPLPKKAQLKRSADQIWESAYDKLAERRFRERGNKYRPEPPTMTAKVRDEGGELWRGGLPLEENLQALREIGIANNGPATMPYPVWWPECAICDRPTLVGPCSFCGLRICRRCRRQGRSCACYDPLEAAER